MNSNIVFGIGGAVIGLILAVFFTTTVFPSWNGGFGMMGWRNNSVLTQERAGRARLTGTIDQHFIEQMVPHHEGAIAMAKLALERSKRTEIKTLAAAIIDSQSKEITDMKGWYRDWFKADVPEISKGTLGSGMMFSSGMHMGGQEDVAALTNAADFDKAFLEAMIPHHQLALMMAQMLEAGTNRTKMLQLAKNITVSQSKEIRDMQGWYTEWYK